MARQLDQTIRSVQAMDGRMMHFIRVIIAIVVALSLMTLPATRDHASAASNSFTASDCAEYGSPIDHTSKVNSGCALTKACPGMCMSYSATAVFTTVFQPAIAMMEPLGTNSDAASQIGNPPFHPPRV